jgi:hypothetical protein
MDLADKYPETNARWVDICERAKGLRQTKGFDPFKNLTLTAEALRWMADVAELARDNRDPDLMICLAQMSQSLTPMLAAHGIWGEQLNRRSTENN